MSAYYNEFDPYAAQWLRNLIKAGHIAPGDVDERSILDVRPYDLKQYTQCHFFAGIGVWSYALRRAGWADDRPVWTGSCPCQPFSAAGRHAGFDDERHLWPALFHLIEARRPVAVFGEQVASKDGYTWLDLVQADLEGSNYAFGAVVAPAAGFGAPHRRHRMYWVADADDEGLQGREFGRDRTAERVIGARGVAGGLADTPEGRRGEFRGEVGAGNIRHVNSRSDALGGFWSAADWIYCRDEKYRPVEPGSFPLAHGATARVGRLRAYGNAICAPQAEEFIRAYDSVAT